MINGVVCKSYAAPDVNLNEVLRYMRAAKGDKAAEQIIRQCIKESESDFTYRVCYKEYPVSYGEDYTDLGFCKVSSLDLRKNLKGAPKIILFAATVGIGADRFIAKCNLQSPVKALAADALATERAESLCDTFNAEITKEAAKQGLFTAPRFSAGYGDFPIEYQKEITAALCCDRNIGVTLSDSYLMIPTKSVTGIIGLTDKKCDTARCNGCTAQNCEFRRNE